MVAADAALSMPHSEAVRQFFERMLFDIFGEDAVKNSIVEFMPTKAQIDGMTAEEHKTRTFTFFVFFGSVAFLGIVLVEVLRMLLNRSIEKGSDAVAGQGHDDSLATPLLRSSTALPMTRARSRLRTSQQADVDDAVEEAAEAMKNRIAGFDTQDLLFAQYHMIYVGFCITLVMYAFMNDWISGNFGLDFELYFPWVLATILMHMVCLLLAFRTGRKSGTRLPSTYFAIPNTIMNPVAAHFCTIRDAVAAGIYAQHSFNDAQSWWSFWVPLVLSGIAMLVIVLPSLWICFNVYPFRDYQSGFWPIIVNFDKAKQAECQEPAADTGDCSEEALWTKQDFITKVRKLAAFFYDDLTSHGGLRDDTKKKFRVFVLGLGDEKTRQDMQAVAVLGDLPKAIIGAFFWIFFSGKQSSFILFVTVLCAVKSFFILFLRPRILCCLAYYSMPWSRLTAWDVERTIDCTGWLGVAGWAESFGIDAAAWHHLECQFRLGTWIHRSKACRGLLKDNQSDPSVRKGAITAFKKLLSCHDIDPSPEGDEEKECIKLAMIWEVASQQQSSVSNAARNVMRHYFSNETAWKDAAPVLHRLRSSDLGEISLTAKRLVKDFPMYAQAYVSDLVRLISRHPAFEDTCAAGADEEAKKRAGKAALKEYQLVRRVRHAAAEALGKLARQTTTRGAISVKVADSVLKLLDHTDADVRSAAVSAIVQFSGRACDMAVARALDLLSTPITERNAQHLRTAAEIVLVKLLPLTLEDQRSTHVRRVVDILKGRAQNPEASEAAFHVLSRMGSGAAKEVLDELERAPQGLPEAQLHELREVLMLQRKAYDLTGGMAATNNLNLVLDRKEEYMAKAKELLRKIRAGEEVFDLLGKESEARMLKATPGSSSDDSDVLPVIFSDLEPDDIMFAAEMWKYLRDQPGGCCKPLVIFSADLSSKDGGEVFEKKILLTALMLGPVDHIVLTPAEHCRSPPPKKPHPLAKRMDQLRESNLRTIAARLKSFKDKKVMFYICAPGRGNLGAIAEKLKEPGANPDAKDLGFKQCRVQLYSGMFNIKGMSPDDLEAIYKLVGEPPKPRGEVCEQGVLLDAAKFPFFGGEDNHELTKSFTTIALPSFAPLLSSRRPLIAAVWALVNDEFNKKLVAPEKIFENMPGQEVQARLKELYDAGQIKEYANFIGADPHLARQVVKKKRVTLQSFACDCCDAPLCDQLIFLIQWMRDRQPPANVANGVEFKQTWLTDEEGVWNFNRIRSYTAVDTINTGLGLKGKQPVMREPHDVETLYLMSEALQDYTLNHLEDLSEPMSGADIAAARVFPQPQDTTWHELGETF